MQDNKSDSWGLVKGYLYFSLCLTQDFIVSGDRPMIIPHESNAFT